MASARYDYLKKDIPPPEPPKEYTKKEKRQNFWHYYKWHFVVGFAILAIVFSFIYSIATKVQPDYTIGLISGTSYPEGMVKNLETGLKEFGYDRNGDGETIVIVNQYTLQLSEEDSGGDPNMQAANMTRLVGDLQMFESMIFLTPQVEKVQQAQGFFAYNDGTSPVEGAEVDYSKMGIKWADCKALTTLPLGTVDLDLFSETENLVDTQVMLEDMSVVMRVYESPRDTTEKALYYKDCLDMFNKMTAK